MTLPDPEPGLVISYSYLWRDEHKAGQEEGLKVRPCVIVLTVEKKDRNTVVLVAPMTHRIPSDPDMAVELPLRIKQHLKLDHEKSWVILSEVNEFVWPGYDLQTIPENPKRYDYGFLPPQLFDKIKTKFLDLLLQRHSRITPRH